uniref:CDK5 regulatory subunit-associated protein 3 (CDK5 activator-binding protein C53) n=2 Tax=Schistosoma japonicum TaxID=6182 RepID=C1L527_SCHJA|nr:CDK5 regulatory subunit-associated protein 3 (CDK5 activator-binding protein C53) [Schistosoma japonicum]
MKDVDQQHVTPLLIQSSKINGWLLSRKIIQADYPRKLKEIVCKVNEYVDKSPELTVKIFDNSSLYLGCREVLDALSQTDNKTDFFGRSSPLVRAWTEIVSLFQKNNLYLAEVGDSIKELAGVQVPRCKMFVSDKQKNLLDLRQKLKERNLNLNRKEELLEKVYKEFQVDVEEKNIRLRLLEEAENVPIFLTAFVQSLASLETALQLYIRFRCFVMAGFQDVGRNHEKFSDCCPTLKLLIDSGHVMVFTWKNGYKPEHIEGNDDFIPFLLQQEKMRVNQSTMEIGQNEPTEVNVPSEPNEIMWDDNELGEIDFGPLILDSVEGIEIETDSLSSMASPGVLNNRDVDSSSQSKFELSVKEGRPIVASGASSRYLLDSIDGRQALLNDLLELKAFLLRFQEDLHERLDNESRTGRNTLGRSGSSGSDTIHSMIMQNAPNDLQSYTTDDITKMIELVNEALDKMTTSSLSQLMMIRTKIGYLDRLTDRLMDYRRQVELARTRVNQTQHLIDKAIKEQEEKTVQLTQHRDSCRKLVNFLESELSTICNRQVQITGQFCDL